MSSRTLNRLQVAAIGLIITASVYAAGVHTMFAIGADVHSALLWPLYPAGLMLAISVIQVFVDA